MVIIAEKYRHLVNKRLLLLAGSLSGLLTACAFGYQARGHLDGVGELRGKAFPSATQAGGRFALADRAGQLSCDGEVSIAPGASTGDSCREERGDGLVRCSDGRQIPIRWQALGCRAWQGSGVDAEGNRLQFRVERR